MMAKLDRPDPHQDAAAVADAVKRSGQQQSAAALLPLVYEKLHALAKKRMRAERPDHTLQATALVHEVFNHLALNKTSWSSRVHFYRAAATAMRQILIDHARARTAQKRGGPQVRSKRSVVDISSVADLSMHSDPDMILALDDALTKLKSFAPDAEELVRLRFFAGLSIDQAALAMKMGETSLKKKWAFARAFLARELAGEEE